MAIRKPPRRNLPGDAEKWGRYTDDALRQAQVDIEALRRDLTSGLRSVTSSMNRIAAQQATLVEQQATLVEQQARLSEQQDQIIQLVDNMILVRRVGGSDENAGAVGTNERVLIPFTFTVPSGYTKASTYASVNARFNNDKSASDWLSVGVRTDMQPYNTMAYPAPTNNWVWGGATGSSSLTGLRGGQTIRIDAMGYTQSGNMTSGRVIMDAFVLFTK